MQSIPRLLVITLFALSPVACAPLSVQEAPAAQAAQARAAPTAARTVATGEPNRCPVTQLPQPAFVPPPPYAAQPPGGQDFWYGSNALWTALPFNGTWRGLPFNEGGYAQKLFWQREGYDGQTEQQPDLVVTGRRLDEMAPSLITPPKATNGHHPDWGWFMLVGVRIPTLGCWEITGHYRGQQLSFVVQVEE